MSKIRAGFLAFIIAVAVSLTVLGSMAGIAYVSANARKPDESEVTFEVTEDHFEVEYFPTASGDRDKLDLEISLTSDGRSDFDGFRLEGETEFYTDTIFASDIAALEVVNLEFKTESKVSEEPASYALRFDDTKLYDVNTQWTFDVDAHLSNIVATLEKQKELTVEHYEISDYLKDFIEVEHSFDWINYSSGVPSSMEMDTFISIRPRFIDNDPLSKHVIWVERDNKDMRFFNDGINGRLKGYGTNEVREGDVLLDKIYFDDDMLDDIVDLRTLNLTTPADFSLAIAETADLDAVVPGARVTAMFNDGDLFATTDDEIEFEIKANAGNVFLHDNQLTNLITYKTAIRRIDYNLFFDKYTWSKSLELEFDYQNDWEGYPTDIVVTNTPKIPEGSTMYLEYVWTRSESDWSIADQSPNQIRGLDDGETLEFHPVEMSTIFPKDFEYYYPVPVLHKVFAPDTEVTKIDTDALFVTLMDNNDDWLNVATSSGTRTLDPVKLSSYLPFGVSIERNNITTDDDIANEYWQKMDWSGMSFNIDDEFEFRFTTRYPLVIELNGTNLFTSSFDGDIWVTLDETEIFYSYHGYDGTAIITGLEYDEYPFYDKVTVEYIGDAADNVDLSNGDTIRIRLTMDPTSPFKIKNAGNVNGEYVEIDLTLDKLSGPFHIVNFAGIDISHTLTLNTGSAYADHFFIDRDAVIEAMKNYIATQDPIIDINEITITFKTYNIGDPYSEVIDGELNSATYLSPEVTITNYEIAYDYQSIIFIENHFTPTPVI